MSWQRSAEPAGTREEVAATDQACSSIAGVAARTALPSSPALLPAAGRREHEHRESSRT